LPPEPTAILAADFAKDSPHERFIRARTYVETGRLFAEPLGFAKSGMMASLPEADALISSIPPGSVRAEQGKAHLQQLLCWIVARASPGSYLVGVN